jgi:uncharacterized protein DUF3310
MREQPSLKYNPYSGKALGGGELESEYTNPAGWRLDNRAWLFDPWTGAKRVSLHVEKDPLGIYIWHEGKWGIKERPSLAETKPEADTPALGRQVGGEHYKDLAIQPVEYIHRNGLGFIEGSVIKYVTRWRSKGGAEDLRKARHFLDLLIEMEGPAR